MSQILETHSELTGLADLMDSVNRAGAAAFASAREGLAKAGLQLMQDAAVEIPSAPILSGNLRQSGSVFIGQELFGTSKDQGGLAGEVSRTRLIGGPVGEPNTSGPGIVEEQGTIVASVGFNTPYAARWHEQEANFSAPGAGTKYLESKMVQNLDEYMGAVAQSVKGALR